MAFLSIIGNGMKQKSSKSFKFIPWVEKQPNGPEVQMEYSMKRLDLQIEALSKNFQALKEEKD
jgi:hypothetical protein